MKQAVVAEWAPESWRLLVHGETRAAGTAAESLHAALRELALRDRDLARDAFAVVVNCPGSWEDEYTEEHGEGALAFPDWIERLETGLETVVDVDGQLSYYGRVDSG